MKNYFYNLFDVKDNQAVPHKSVNRYNGDDIECGIALELETPNENQWENTPITLDIYVGKEGIGFVHEVPDGYSEYTYDPVTTRNFYYGADLDWFIRFALDSDQRDMISLNDLEILKFALSNPEFLKP